MRFRIEVGPKGKPAEAWWENFDEEEVVDEATAKAWADATLQRFNDTLRPGEEPRRFTGRAELLGAGKKEHRWHKLNITTQSDHRGHFDMMRCEVCRAEGRRYGFGERGVKRAAAWKAKKWVNCPGAPTDGTTKGKA